MDRYVDGGEENYSDFIKELMNEGELGNKGEELFLEEDRESKKITIENYSFLAK